MEEVVKSAHFRNLDSLTTGDYGVMGRTGKSSFVKLLIRNSTVKVGTTLDSETSDVQVFRFVDPATRRNVVIVDTPGFDDSRTGSTDTQILATIAKFFLDEYDNDRQLSALVYLQRISDPRFGREAGRNLRMFQSLCGTKNYKNGIVLTTCWDQFHVEEEGTKRDILRLKPTNATKSYSPATVIPYCRGNVLHELAVRRQS